VPKFMERNDCWVWKKSCSVAFFFRDFLRLFAPNLSSALDSGLSTAFFFTRYKLLATNLSSGFKPTAKSTTYS
jgi:hypothetical protein